MKNTHIYDNMININNKVNPSNGVDFSRIRKHASGGNVMKFQKPASGITYNSGTSWYNNVFSGFKAELLKRLKENPDLFEEINALQDLYQTNRALNTSLGQVTFNQAVKDYQDEINKNYSFVNTGGIAGGHNAGRYNFVQQNSNLRTSGDNSTEGWVSDGYWGAQTLDRTILGYYGDFTDELLAAWNKELEAVGMETYLDGNVYKLKKSTNPVLSTTSATTQEGPVQDPEEETGRINPYEEVDFPKPFQPEKEPFTAWIPSLINHYQTKKAINTLLNNELQKKVPLAEALHQNYTIADDKATTDAYNQAAADFRQKGALVAASTGDITSAMAALFAYDDAASKYSLQGQLAKTQAYNQSIKEAQQVANWNNQQSAATANANKQNLIADWNAKLNAKSQAAVQHATNDQNLVNNISGDYSRYLKDLRQNAYNAIKAQNDYQASLDKQEAQKGYYDKLKNPMGTTAFNDMYNQVWEYYINNPTDTENPILSYITANDVEDLDDVTKRKNLYDWLNANSSTTWGKQWVTNYEAETTAAKDLANEDIAKIRSNQARTKQYIPLMISDQGIFRLNDINPNAYYKSIYSHKEGGVLSAKNGSRMVKYMEHKRKTAQDKKKNDLAVLEMNRKSRSDLRKQEQQAAKQLQESLKRELESLDRETLLLLRSVFK